jgi:hypothetical protein
LRKTLRIRNLKHRGQGPPPGNRCDSALIESLHQRQFAPLLSPVGIATGMPLASLLDSFSAVVCARALSASAGK